MKRNLRYLLPALVLLVFSKLGAQTETVNLATLADINVTLDENCQATIVASEVIRGDLDADGNGIEVPLSSFIIVVEDADQSNGPVVDGCGDYIYRVTGDGSFLGLEGGAWGDLSAEDKLAPVIQPFPDDLPLTLFCDAAVDTITVTKLPEDVDRCYQVDGQTGEVIEGTLDPVLEDRLLDGGVIPSALDNCSTFVTICVSDVITRNQEDPGCNDVILTRTFTATDGSCKVAAPGEQNPADVASYQILFSRPGLDDLEEFEISDTVSISCTSALLNGLEFGEIPAPRRQDLPFFISNGNRVYLGLNDTGLCNFGLTFTDNMPIPGCDDSYKVIRIYTVIDWCNPEDIRTFRQIVKVGDFEGPVIGELPRGNGGSQSGPYQFSTNGGDRCGAIIQLDPDGLTVTDDCSDSFTVFADIYPFGDLDATPIGTFTVNLDDNTADVTTLIPLGTHILRYTAVDGCGNQSFRDFDIEVVDNSQPVAICEDGLNVSVTLGSEEIQDGQNGIAVITPEMIDKDSYDACGPVRLLIARVGDDNQALEPYGLEVVVTCADLGEVAIGLEVTDTSGLANYCWLDVLVEDKAEPVCTAPDDIAVTCTDYRRTVPADINELSDAELDALFGAATGSNNCDNPLRQQVTGGLNNCGIGQLVRTFTVTDGEGEDEVICSQTIDIIGVHDYTIRFPGDREAFCGAAMPDLRDIRVTENGCDLITKDMKIDTFIGDAEECFKLRIKYTILNWCEYNTLGRPYEVPRDFDLNNSLEDDVYLYIDPNDLTTINDDIAYVDIDSIRDEESFRIVLDDGLLDGIDDDNNGNDIRDTSRYAFDNSRGFFCYTQIYRVFDEVPPAIAVDEPDGCFGAISANCTAEVEISYQAEDSCTTVLETRVGLDVDFKSDTAFFSRDRFLTDEEVEDLGNGDFRVILSNVPVGSHAIRIRVTDGCGNFDNEIVEFCVTDEKAPTPICKPQLTVTLMPNGDGTGMAAIWATDYVASEVQDCSGEVQYSIYTEATANEADFVPAVGDDGIILTCDSDQTTQVRIYAIDPVGQADYCSAFVLTQRADNACVTEDANNTGTLAGVIFSEEGESVTGVSLILTGNELTERTVTDEEGYYEFDELAEGEDYTIEAVLRDYTNHAQGVSTFDLVLITNHILGTKELTSPYELLAADANNDSDISVQDIIAIRRLILGLYLEYPSSAAYRFVPADFVFPVLDNPWATAFPEVINENNLSGSIRDADFFAIMVGDVDGNGFRVANNVAPRSAAPSFSAPDMEMAAGESYSVVLTAGSTLDLIGLQGTLTVGEGADLIDLNYGQFVPGNVNDRIMERGLLPFSYNGGTGLAPESAVITLELKATKNVRLSEVLSITDHYLRAEGYTFGGSITGLTVAFTPEEQFVPVVGLEQNNPNPVDERTTINFTLAEDLPVELTLRDLTGRLLLRRSLAGYTGRNRLVIDRAEIGMSGVITYTLTAGDYSATRKMIVR